MNSSSETALAARLNQPTTGARRLDRARRAIDSPWALIGVAGGALAAAFTPLSLLVPAGIVGAYGVSLAVVRFRLNQFFAAMRPAYAEAERGSFALAFETSRDAMERGPWPISHLGAIATAYFLRRQGHLDRAIEIIGLAAKTDDGFLRTAIGVELAVCFALKGATATAMTWLPELNRRHSATAASHAIVFARTGRADEIDKLRVLSGRRAAPFVLHDERVLAVMKAFVLFGKEPDYLSIRPLLLAGGPKFAGEFDYLGSSWPEMQEFLDTYVAPAR